MGKKRKDPLAPKPPLNSYLEFSNEERPKVIVDLGKVSTTEIGKEIGLRWQKLNKEEKEKYVAKFKENQERYKLEKQKYDEINTTADTVAAPGNKKHKKKNPLAPKLPLSSYMEFAKQQRPNVLAEKGSLSLIEVGKELGRRWQDLSKPEKEVYELKSKENRATYNSEMEAFVKRVAADQESSGLVVPDSPEQISEAASNPPAKSQSTQSENQTSPPVIKLEHLGFAKQKGYSWHPALKTSELARGSRVMVTFFGTGQVGTVDMSGWVVYSEQSLARITTPKLVKAGIFQTGLQQLKSLRDKLLSDSPVTSSGIGFTPQVGNRRFRSLNKDHLQIEEEENNRQMEKKMYQEGGGKLWKCRDCRWKGKYGHKAKGHARDCGQRKKTSKTRAKDKKFDCSNGDCDQSFALRSQLFKHYRYTSSIVFPFVFITKVSTKSYFPAQNFRNCVKMSNILVSFSSYNFTIQILWKS